VLNKQNVLYKAFSLIEISVVLVIIGMLLTLISSTKTIIAKTKLAKAVTLTKNSPVLAIDNLELWLETSLKSSFDEGIKDGEQISIWYDQNSKAYNKNNPSQGTSSSQPTYRTNVFEGVPAVYFSGSQSLAFDGNFLIDSSFTAFAIGSIDILNENDQFLAGSNNVKNKTFYFGHRKNGVFGYAQYNGYVGYAPPSGFKINKLYMHTIMFNKDTDERKYWFAGGQNPDAQDINTDNKLVSFNGAAIGGTSINGPYNGNILELIFYSRALKKSERIDIENYLSKKYNIAIE